MIRRLLLPALLLMAALLAACSTAATAAEAVQQLPPTEQVSDGTGQASAELARTDAQGSVEFVVTPLNLAAPSETLDFRVVMDTHSVDLAWNLAAQSRLRTDTGAAVNLLGEHRRSVDEQATGLTRARYQRLSLIYDWMEALAERRYRPWRERLWALVEGPRVLEIGVGTGKNMPYWPNDVQLTAIDLTPGMLAIASRRATKLGQNAALRVADAQALDFADASFNTAVATFVFCSVPDPVLGLSELARVVRPGGRVLLLEHVRSANPIVAALMDFFNPVIVRLIGANINRRTVANVRAAGLEIERLEDLRVGGIFKLIVARTEESRPVSPAQTRQTAY